MSRPVRILVLLVLTAALVAPATAGARTVVHGKRTSFSLKNLTGTYSAPQGSFTARFLERRHYALTGTINGKRLRGTIRTRPTDGGKRFVARGSRTWGGTKVKIRGGGPRTLKRATLILR